MVLNVVCKRVDGGAVMFVGRRREFQTLENLYASGRFEFAVIYGRRRVGKTALINRFIEDKAAIYCMGVENSAAQNLENLGRVIMAQNTDTVSEAVFGSFQSALEAVFKLSQAKRIVLAIDEYPYIAKSAKSFASTLQMLIDKYKDSSKLMLILCGSSMSYMENEVLSYKAPLYGRRTAQMRLAPFSFAESCEVLGQFSDEDKALAYGIMGGTPQYLLQLDTALSIEQNIRNTFLNPNSFIFEEPLNLLKQEVREPAVYNAIITAIACGASKLSEITTKTQLAGNLCATYIKNLLKLGIVCKESCYGETTARKTIYSVADNMYRFWYRFVPQNSSLIERGAADIAYNRIAPEFSTYMGRVFEEISRQFLWQQLLRGKSAVRFAALGRWWGANTAKRRQEEIDIVAEENKTRALYCECKWTNEPVGSSVLETLIERSNLLKHKEKYYCIFSKSGFTQGCEQLAMQQGNTRLVSFSDIMGEIAN